MASRVLGFLCLASDRNASARVQAHRPPWLRRSVWGTYTCCAQNEKKDTIASCDLSIGHYQGKSENDRRIKLIEDSLSYKLKLYQEKSLNDATPDFVQYSLLNMATAT